MRFKNCILFFIFFISINCVKAQTATKAITYNSPTIGYQDPKVIDAGGDFEWHNINVQLIMTDSKAILKGLIEDEIFTLTNKTIKRGSAITIISYDAKDSHNNTCTIRVFKIVNKPTPIYIEYSTNVIALISE